MIDVQELEDQGDIRFKFVVFEYNNKVYYDAYKEYELIFEDFDVEGWLKLDYGSITTRTEGIRQAWIMENEEASLQIAAVEHESGIELLLWKIGEKIGVEIVKSVVKKIWQKWKGSRKQLNKDDNLSLIIEKVEERFPDGKIKRTNRVEIRGPIKLDELSDYLASALE